MVFDMTSLKECKSYCQLHDDSYFRLTCGASQKPYKSSYMFYYVRPILFAGHTNSDFWHQLKNNRTYHGSDARRLPRFW